VNGRDTSAWSGILGGGRPLKRGSEWRRDKTIPNKKAPQK